MVQRLRAAENVVEGEGLGLARSLILLFMLSGLAVLLVVLVMAVLLAR
jgi:hypothetical protein